jgi:dual specificity tyrosine-phosphorylation-regulated kinase 2/3/4
LAKWDSAGQYHLIRYTDHFNFREHLCISTELLGINLYELVKYNGYKGLPIPLIKHFTKQLLEALEFLRSKSVIHCDLKPENILLNDVELGKIKIIDFGSSCYESEKVYTYIQSRFYRSPEVLLGMVYSYEIDMWSLGCIISELITGRPIFMGENEQEQVACIMETFGVPDKTMISRCSRRKLFFDSMGNPREVVSSDKSKRIRRPNSRTLEQELKMKDEVLTNFISGFLAWDPVKRTTPKNGLMHEFITGIRSQTSLRNIPTSSLPVVPLHSDQVLRPERNLNTPQARHASGGSISIAKASPRQIQQRSTPIGHRREMGHRLKTNS